MQKILLLSLGSVMLMACGGRSVEKTPDESDAPKMVEVVKFDCDSAYDYVKKQVDFGPRVPNTSSHKSASRWLASELRRHGASVTEMPAILTAFDGTRLETVNIIGQYNSDKEDRTLFVAHWDSRPWADADQDESKHKVAVDGANDGASGTGLLLEIARQFSMKNPGKGIDILFVDAEDYGTEGDDESWALGAKKFVEKPFKEGYLPSRVILVDMVGGMNATFMREYFSQQSAPSLAQEIWDIAAASGYSDYFINRMGGAVTDDHVQFIKTGIPAIDIIDYRIEGEQGFFPQWHTTGDNMDVISKETLKAVGQTLVNYIYR